MYFIWRRDTTAKGTKGKKIEYIAKCNTLTVNEWLFFLSGPCYEFNCTVSSEVCLVIADTAKCECPECSGLEEDSVCAAVGTSKDTYKNPCEARREACNQTEPMEILNVGECGGETGSSID